MPYIIEVETGILNCYTRVGDSHFTFSVLPFDTTTTKLSFTFDWKKQVKEAELAYIEASCPFGAIKQIRSVDLEWLRESF
jgi:hypothetical protein